ncbi:hypothetical protein J5N97_028883 [Dioscorea zingiberensis]|uniref:Pentatricopeptide repeat-containing protein n=1 Tax=Dioscorea zingiberensis TaxID=325984 RepID=A0A9D5BZR8_9LILI|nr:hypothetical protein J5N97_028883 [Dioscorea zingiberensis]
MPWFSNRRLFGRLSLKIIHVFALPIRGLCRLGSSCHLHDWIPRAGDDQQVVKFSEVVKHLSQRISGSSSCLEIGARPRNPHPFEYNNLMKAYAQAGRPDEVLRLLDEMQQSNFDIDVPCYTTAINSLVVSERFEEAVAVFKDMVLSGLALDVASCTVLLKMYACYLKQFDSAYQVLQWMVKLGCNPDVVTYSTLIAGLCHAGRVQEALGVLKLMLREQCCPNVHTYTPIVQAYCFKGKILKARRLVDSMRDFGCFPNTTTYNVLIEALCQNGSFNEVEKVLEESTMKGWKPDVITYSIYMNGLCKSGDADKAFEQLDVMLEKGLYPNTVTLNILLDCLCHCSKVWEAKCLLERSHDLEWDVNVVNYNTVMSGLCKLGKPSVVLKLLGDMMKKGIDPNTRTFTIVIHSLCRAGRLLEAKFLLHNRVFVANVVTYTILMQYFCWEGNVGEVQNLFAEMEAEGIALNGVTYSVMVDCLCREGKFSEAIDFFSRSLVDGFSPKVAARLIYGLIRGGKLSETLHLLELIAGQGLVLDFCIFHSLIKAFCREGYCQGMQIHEICFILNKMLQLQ